MNCYFFGTFDPIHIGHIKIAKYVEDKFGTKVFFVPTPSSPEKLGQTPVQDRINMLELVLDKEKISKIELEIEPPNYTYKTIEKLGKAYFILGYDQFLNIENWKKTQYLKTMLHFLVIPRETMLPADFTRQKELGYNFDILDFPLVNISSTEIREKAKKGESLEGLVDKKVEDYIYGKRLYS
ncbi:nicotinate (nicotinamide) nucleotide adenylyltransferase [bacterium]|nr:nicotinate (nicotinamide) nucleotide adenylyltransferase [bacterium]